MAGNTGKKGSKRKIVKKNTLYTIPHMSRVRVGPKIHRKLSTSVQVDDVTFLVSFIFVTLSYTGRFYFFFLNYSYLFMFDTCVPTCSHAHSYNPLTSNHRVMLLMILLLSIVGIKLCLSIYVSLLLSFHLLFPSSLCFLSALHYFLLSSSHSLLLFSYFVFIYSLSILLFFFSRFLPSPLLFLFLFGLVFPLPFLLSSLFSPPHIFSFISPLLFYSLHCFPHYSFFLWILLLFPRGYVLSSYLLFS